MYERIGWHSFAIESWFRFGVPVPQWWWSFFVEPLELIERTRFDSIRFNAHSSELVQTDDGGNRPNDTPMHRMGYFIWCEYLTWPSIEMCVSMSIERRIGEEKRKSQICRLGWQQKYFIQAKSDRHERGRIKHYEWERVCTHRWIFSSFLSPCLFVDPKRGQGFWMESDRIWFGFGLPMESLTTH